MKKGEEVIIMNASKQIKFIRHMAFILVAVLFTSCNSQVSENELYQEAEKLIELNKIAYIEIFGLSMLDMTITENTAVEKVLYPVRDGRFTSYATLEEFVRGTYVKKEADVLLSNGRYHNVEGKLYGDLSKDTGEGYYIDWNKYSYQVSDITEKSAVLKILIGEDSPTGDEEETITVEMQKENDVWLLEKMIE